MLKRDPADLPAGAPVDLLVRQLGHRDGTVRQRAALELLSRGPEVVEPLCDALSRVPGGVRPALCAVLGELKDERAIGALNQFVIGAPWSGSSEAIAAIGRIGGPRAQVLLLPMLDHWRTEHAQAAAIALGGMRARDAALPLGRALNAPDNTEGGYRLSPGTRKEVALALGRIGNPAAVPALLEALERARDAALRTALIAALAQCGHVTPHTICELWKIPHREAGWQCLLGIGPAAAPALVALLDAQDRLREWATEALVLFRPDSFAPVAAAAREGSEALRCAAFEVLARMQDPRAFEILLAGAREPLPGLQVRALLALGTFGHPDGLEGIRALWPELEPGARPAAAIARVELGDRDPELAPWLIEVLDLNRVDQLVRAAGALGRLASAGSAAALVPAVTHLRRLAQPWSGASVADRGVYRWALDRIEIATRETRSLPLPASGDPTPEALPIPAQEAYRVEG